MKLSEYHCALQDYLWQDRVYAHTRTTSEMIYIHNDNYNATIKYFSTENMRVLVGVPITPSNESKNIVLFYQDKIKDHIFQLKSTNIGPQ